MRTAADSARTGYTPNLDDGQLQLNNPVGVAKPPPGQPDLELKAKADKSPRAPRLSVRREMGSDGRWAVGSPHSDEEGHRAALCDTLGTSSEDFASATLRALGRAGHPAFPGRGDTELSAALAIIAAAEPRNELETALAANAAAAHQLALKVIEKAMLADHPFATAALASAASRLMRACSEQALALDRLRRKADQVISVQYVHLAPGARAVVTHDLHPRGIEEYARRPQRPAVVARSEVEGSPPLRCHNEGRDALPEPGGAREGEVPHPRRRSR